MTRPKELLRRHVEDEEMVAICVEAADVAAHQRGTALRDGAAFFIKDFEPQPLRPTHFLFRRREPDLEIAGAAEHMRQAARFGSRRGVAKRAAARGNSMIAPKSKGVLSGHIVTNHPRSLQHDRLERPSESLMTPLERDPLAQNSWPLDVARVFPVGLESLARARRIES